MGFSMPFPLNIFFFPVGILEWYIQWDGENDGGQPFEPFVLFPPPLC